MNVFRLYYDALGMGNQKSAADELGVTQASISHWLSGKPAPEPVMKLLAVLARERGVGVQLEIPLERSRHGRDLQEETCGCAELPGNQVVPPSAQHFDNQEGECK